MTTDHLLGVSNSGQVMGFVPLVQRGDITHQLLLTRNGHIKLHLLQPNYQLLLQ